MGIAVPKPKDQPKTRSALLPYKEYAGGRQVCRKTKAGRDLYRLRTLQMAERQFWLCCLCGLTFRHLEDISFEHEFSRGAGGWKREDRIEIDGRRVNGAAHGWCNAAKGSRKIPYRVR